MWLHLCSTFSQVCIICISIMISVCVQMSTQVLEHKHADIMIISKVKRSRRRRRQMEAKRMDDMFHRKRGRRSSCLRHVNSFFQYFWRTYCSRILFIFTKMWNESIFIVFAWFSQMLLQLHLKYLYPKMNELHELEYHGM